MTRTALVRLLAVVALVAAGVAIATPGAAGGSTRPARYDSSVATHLPSATADPASPETASVTATRDGSDARHSSLRMFSATLAAIVALVALAAARGTRSPAFATRAASPRFAARRRGPPLLPAC